MENQTPSVLQTIHNEISRRIEHFRSLLPDSVSPKRFALIAYSHIRKSPDLVKCDVMNLVAEVSKAAELGLDFSIPNEVSLVPFKDHKSGTVRCSAIPGYKGYAKLARQSESVKSLSYNVVHEGDVFEVEMGSDPKVIHRPNFPSSNKILAFYALGVSKTGGIFGPVVLSVEEVEKHAKRYIKAGFGPFGGVKTEGRSAENFVAYGLKTVLLQLAKRHLDLSARGVSMMKNDLDHMEEPAAPTPKVDLNAELDREIIDAEWKLSNEKPNADSPTASAALPTGSSR